MIKIGFYGFVYFAATIFAFFLIKDYLKKERKNPEEAFRFTLLLVLGTIIEARVFYILFYNFSYFFYNPLEMFNIFKGGLSFHGGLLGGLVTCFFYCKYKKIDFLNLTDKLTFIFAFFLILGKVANFINEESYGIITNFPLCVNFNSAEGCRHPVQLYETVKNLFLFFFVIYLKSKKPRKGMITFSFIFLYSFLRFFIDFLREYEALYFGVGMGQYLNIITFVVSGLFLYHNYKLSK
jgi:phosphatidylglycerol---prolipoprotein diacylglyceryl transferase